MSETMVLVLALEVAHVALVVGLWAWFRRRLALLGADHRVLANEQRGLRDEQAARTGDTRTLARIDMDLSDVVLELRAMRALMERLVPLPEVGQ